ncbi:DEAD/DEAH box helicase, putative [Talaromyces stipitatus ATCC 10500]|uniref:DEAD/DEAH box helicase, putative n=1 Tax=Talaromyces stipitatus (strain ATCC 10500 / CBS 375.48 / QM 6759 / NRRL 1006) TaxID=441959 RepID=B8MIT3_TALSN|nr:DEAD/DEAH box helicase, putative [Talaromyces stipitatus ATCC 10500]EED15595.1 DEAD/DEAH box helicase, putative [Talaromyces stipitatus ATCC 10500]
MQRMAFILRRQSRKALWSWTHNTSWQHSNCSRFPRTLPLLITISRYASTTTEDIVPPKIKLRDYQEESIQSVLEHLEKGHNRLGLSLATGSGKTVIFTQLIGRVPPRNGGANQTLIIAHRKELVEQAARHCRLAYPDKSIEIEMGANKASGAADITVASIRSLSSKDRIEKFDPSLFKLVLVDEAHHIVAPQYRQALSYFSLTKPSNNAPVLVGVSATFFRFDGLKLGSAIDHIVYHKDYIDMIGEKWLSDAIFTTVKTHVDLSRVARDSSGDFATRALSEAVNTATVNDVTVRSWLTHASDRRSTLVFCVDIEHVHQLTEAFRDNGIDARYITANTPRQTRNEELEAFKRGEYPVLLNCGLFTEGTDIPNIDCVVLARPTRSKSLLIQMIGRGLRLHPEKENCHIIDMVSTLNTGIMSTPTLFGLDPDEALNTQSVQEIRKQKEQEDISSPIPDVSYVRPLREDEVDVTFTTYDSVFDLLNDERVDRHIRSISRYAWVRVNADRYILADKSGWMTIEKGEQNIDGPWMVELVQKYETAAGMTVHTRPRVIARAPDFEQAVRSADTFASTNFKDFAINSSQIWRRAPASDSQLKVLNSKKILDREITSKDLTRGQAADMLTKLRFGTKNRFQSEQRRKKKEEKMRKEFERQMSQGDVKVGSLSQQDL